MKEFEENQPFAYKILSSAIKKDKIVNAYLLEDNGTNQGMSIACAFCEQILQEQIGLTANAYIINPDGVWIKKDQIDEVKRQFTTKAIIGKSKVYIINGAEKLNPSASSALLKFLEEPDPDIYAILITSNTNQVLETIKSRCLLVPLVRTNVRNQDLIINLKNEMSFPEITEMELTEEKVDEVINFIEYIEKNKIKTLLHVKRLIKNFKYEKQEMILLFNILLLFYKDVLEYKATGNIELFQKYDRQIKIVVNNKDQDLVKKIKLIIEVLDDLKYNVNIQMEIDKFIMKMEEI